MTKVTKDWSKDASCKDEPNVDFYSSDPMEKKLAKSICAACPVKQMCLQTAMSNSERFGIWGGSTEEERRKDLAINVKGEPHVSTQGKIRCAGCGPLSTRYIEVVARHRTRTDLMCTNCGLEWSCRKLINKRLSNF